MAVAVEAVEEFGLAGKLEARAQRAMIPSHGDCSAVMPEIVVIDYEKIKASTDCPNGCGARFVINQWSVIWRQQARGGGV